MSTREARMTMTSGVGTPFYMAPEMATSSHYTNAVDVYSFGIMAAQVMLGVFDISIPKIQLQEAFCLFPNHSFQNILNQCCVFVQLFLIS